MIITLYLKTQIHPEAMPKKYALFSMALQATMLLLTRISSHTYYNNVIYPYSIYTMEMTRGLFFSCSQFECSENISSSSRYLLSIIITCCSVLKTLYQADSRLLVLIIEYFIIWDNTHIHRPRDLIYAYTKEDITLRL